MKSKDIPIKDSALHFSVHCGRKSAFLVINGTFFAWGDNDSYHLGTNDIDKIIKTPTRTRRLSADIISLAAGDSHVVALTAEGICYAWGNNAMGQLGSLTTLPAVNQRHCSVSQPILADLWGSKKVIGVAAGHAHTVALTTEGDLWGLGSNEYGEIGSEIKYFTSKPVKIVLPEKALHVSAFSRNTLVQTESGNFYLLGEKAKDNKPLLLTVIDKKGHPVQLASLSLGVLYNLALTKQGEYFQWGDHSSIRKKYLLPNPCTEGYYLARMKSKKIISSATGDKHSLLLSHAGTVYSWGAYKDGQLGRGLARSEEKIGRSFCSIPEFAEKKIKSVHAGGNYSLAISDHYEVYVWGNNHKGQLGLGDIENRTTPTLNHYLTLLIQPNKDSASLLARATNWDMKRVPQMPKFILTLAKLLSDEDERTFGLFKKKPMDIKTKDALQHLYDYLLAERKDRLTMQEEDLIRKNKGMKLILKNQSLDLREFTERPSFHTRYNMD